MPASDRPRFRIDANREAGARRVRYVETNRPDDGSCTLCRLDEDNPAPMRTVMSDTPDQDQQDEAFAETQLIEAVENQIAAGEPAAAQATLNKLTLVGFEREESLMLMASVLAHEIRSMLREERPFDLDNYERMLRALPELPASAEADEAQ